MSGDKLRRCVVVQPINHGTNYKDFNTIKIFVNLFLKKRNPDALGHSGFLILMFYREARPHDLSRAVGFNHGTKRFSADERQSRGR
jgi:hypothetical protein